MLLLNGTTTTTTATTTATSARCAARSCRSCQCCRQLAPVPGIRRSGSRCSPSSSHLAATWAANSYSHTSSSSDGAGCPRPRWRSWPRKRKEQQSCGLRALNHSLMTLGLDYKASTLRSEGVEGFDFSRFWVKVREHCPSNFGPLSSWMSPLCNFRENMIPYRLKLRTFWGL